MTAEKLDFSTIGFVRQDTETEARLWLQVLRQHFGPVDLPIGKVAELVFTAYKTKQLEVA